MFETRFRKVLAASLEKFMAHIPKLEQPRDGLAFHLRIEIGTAITSNGDDMAETGIRAVAALTWSDSIEVFARDYVLPFTKGEFTLPRTLRDRLYL